MLNNIEPSSIEDWISDLPHRRRPVAWGRAAARTGFSGIYL